MIFTIITEDLQKELKSNLPHIRILLKRNPAMTYTYAIQFLLDEKFMIVPLNQESSNSVTEDFL